MLMLLFSYASVIVALRRNFNSSFSIRYVIHMVLQRNTKKRVTDRDDVSLQQATTDLKSPQRCVYKDMAEGSPRSRVCLGEDRN